MGTNISVDSELDSSYKFKFSNSVQLLSGFWLCNSMDCSRQGFPVHHQLPEFTQTHVHWVSDAIHLILCHPLLLPPSVFPCIRVFSSESVLPISWPKYWSFSFSINPSNEYSELISFRMHWFDLLAVQGTLESLLRRHSSKASIYWHSAFFIVQLSHPYMTNGKTIALTRWTFVGKVMSLLFNMLSRLVTAILSQSKCLLISWLQSTSAVILEPHQNNVSHCFHCFPSICHEVMGWDAMILVFWILSQPFHSPFYFHQELFSFSSLSAIRVVSSAYLRLLIFLPEILIPACASSCLMFHMIYSAYKLYK